MCHDDGLERDNFDEIVRDTKTLMYLFTGACVRGNRCRYTRQVAGEIASL